MKTLKAGKPIDLASILYPLLTDSKVYYIQSINKVMHREALLSMQCRVVIKWAEEGNVREAVKMTDQELAIQIVKDKAKRKAIAEYKKITGEKGNEFQHVLFSTLIHH